MVLPFENEALPINDKIKFIGEIINDALSELRRLSKSLTNNYINTTNITISLKEEFAKIEALKKHKVDLKIDFESIPLNYQAKSLLLSVVQEYIQKSIKHAACKIISATIINNNKQLVLTLSNDDKGFNIENR